MASCVCGLSVFDHVHIASDSAPQQLTVSEVTSATESVSLVVAALRGSKTKDDWLANFSFLPATDMLRCPWQVLITTIALMTRSFCSQALSSQWSAFR